MKPAAILSEAWRDIASGTTRALACAAALAVIATCAAVADLADILMLQRESRQWAASAAAVHIIAGSGQIDPASCANLATASAAPSATSGGERATPIRAAGALGDGGTVSLTAMPAAPLDVWLATPGLADVLGIGAAQQADAGVWISSQLADTLHAGEGDDLPTDLGVMHISAVFRWPDDSRDQRLAYAIVAPTPADAARQWDECWAVIDPANPGAEDLLGTAAIAVPGAAPATQTKQANAALGTNPDIPDRYRGRATRIMLAAAPIAAFVIALAAVRARRVELADDVHMGIPRGGIHAALALETFAWAVPAVLGAAASATVVAAWAGGRGHAPALAAVQLPSLAAALVTAQIGVIVGVLGVRDDQLFMYFKNRR